MTSDRASAGAPYVIVIVLNWNGLVDTVECVESLRNVHYRNFKVVIVDNGSANSEAFQIKQYFGRFAHLIENEHNLGFAGGCNVGIGWALDQGAEYVMLLNNDAVVAPDFLSEAVDVALQGGPKVAAVACKTFEYENRERACVPWAYLAWWPFRGRLMRDEQVNGASPVKVYSAEGPAVLVSLAVMRAVGMLDERFFAYHEMTDWCLRAGKLGYVCLWTPRAKVWHKVSNERSDTAQFLSVRNLLLLVRKHCNLAQQIVFLAWFLKEQAVRGVELLLHDPKQALTKSVFVARALIEGVVPKTIKQRRHH